MRRLLSLLLTAALLAGVLVGTAAGTAFASTPQDQVTIAAADATALLGVDRKDDDKIHKALEDLAEALDPAYWDGSGAVNDDDVFKALEKAVKELEKIKASDPSAIIDALVGAAAVLAQAAIDEAAAAGADTAKAVDEMAKAGKELAKGKPDKAIEHYGKAWKKADEHRGGSGIVTIPGAPAGRYSLYDVVFVRADTVNWPRPIFLAVSGNNIPGTPGDTGSGNEGYVFHPAFGPTDTFLSPALWPLPTGGIMQLHVSCSDAFPGGIGAKSDPQPTSTWLINHIAIRKMSNGVVAKDCNVSGVGLPYQPTPPVPPPN